MIFRNNTNKSIVLTPVAALLAAFSVTALSVTVASPVLAQEANQADDESEEGSEDRDGQGSGLGLAPGIPQVSALAGGFSPAYKPGEEDLSEWHADFHGFIQMPLNIGFNKRAGDVTEDQFDTVMHAPPAVPEYRDSFSYTGALPSPYAQLNFSYGNPEVTANVIIQARAASTGASYFDASTAGGISDAYITMTPQSLPKMVDLMIHVGAFTNRYGITGQYDEGRYGTPLFARTNGVGENIVSMLDLGDFDLELQHGFQGQIDKAPLGVVPGDWNAYADPNEGTSFVHHFHAGVTYKNLVTLGGHYMNAWTADDRANMGDTPDGKIDLVGGDLRFTLGQWGHLYLAGTAVDAKDARSVGRIVEILNAPGGIGLMRNYLGMNSGGNGSLFIMGGQYDLSLARAMYGKLFRGNSPDVFISAFGQRVSVKSEDDAFDGVDKQKIGAEVGYSFLPWMAASVRVDTIAQDLEDVDESHHVISPRLILRTDWMSRDQVMIQYQKYVYGDEVYVRTGTPPQTDPAINPDEDVFSLSGTMWW